MKTGLYIPIQNGYGGAERRLIRVIKSLAEDDSTYFLLLKGENQLINKLIKDEKLNESMIYIAKDTSEIIRIIIKNNIRKIWFFNVDNTILILAVLLRFIRVKLIMTVANFYYSKGIFSNRKVKLAFNYVARRTECIDCLYSDGTDYLKKKFKGKNIFTTPIPFTNSEAFFPKEKRKEIVFASRLIDIKNPILFLKSINKMKDMLSRLGYKVIICGEGKLTNAVIDYINKADLSELVEFKGYIKTEEIFPYSSVFVSIQNDENYPSQSLIEAISCGNFVVISNVGCSSRLVKEDFGVLVDLNEYSVVEGLNIAIEKVQEYGDNVIEKSTEFASQNFSLNESVKYYENILA